MNRELEFLGTLEHVIRERLESGDTDSYTSSLAASGPKRVAQKVGEEGVELALAAASNEIRTNTRVYSTAPHLRAR